jgi:16S rRNA (cytidine1402-2'-O)-methyltransferase
VKTLDVLNTLEPACQICVARELTKHFEEFRRGTVSEVREHFAARNPKGEITLVIAPATRGKERERAEATENGGNEGEGEK